jgi:hypothetical protein
LLPKADLLFVHLRGSDTRPEDTLGDSVRLMEALAWVACRKSRPGWSGGVLVLA